MNKNAAPGACCPIRKLMLLTTAILSLSACTTQKPTVNSAELAATQQCIARQDARDKRVDDQQREILASLNLVQAQLVEQQKLLEAKPQVVEKPIAKADCSVAVSNSRKSQTSQAPQTDKQIVGLREQALITGLNIVMQARISTHVANSVLDARNIQMFERNGEEWVRFTIYNPVNKEPHVLERKRLRFQSVQSSSATPDRRPVVEIRFAIGKLVQKGEFILADRSDSEYPILIGRNLLRDVMLVDVSGNHLAPLQRKEEGQRKDEPKAKE